MIQLIFFAFIVVYALLVFAHKSRHSRAYKLFSFGLLISVLYASVYSFFPDITLVFILITTSIAVLNQYIYWKSIEEGSHRPSRMLVDVARDHKFRVRSNRRARPAKKRRR